LGFSRSKTEKGLQPLGYVILLQAHRVSCAKLITTMREYAVIFEKTSTGWSAYVPDLPGLGVAGPTYEATEQLIREGIDFHIEGLRAYGDPIPQPTTRVARMPISA
jgi:predicted RNase H-like HicB family nuclease